jgi:Spy/CpxP family protein refolding chaperone
MKARAHLLLATALVALFALPLALEARERGGRGAEAILKNPRALARYLKLTPEQVATFKTLRQNLEATVKPLRETGKDLRETLRAELEAANPSACEVGEAALAVQANAERIRGAYEEFDDAFSAILTPEQLARYEALKEAAGVLQGEEG